MSPRREWGVRAQRERLRAPPALGVALPQLGTLLSFLLLFSSLFPCPGSWGVRCGVILRDPTDTPINELQKESVPAEGTA